MHRVTVSEEWRPVYGYEGHYEVSSLGRVRSVDRTVAGPHDGARWRLRGKLMRPTPWRKGYLGINLSKDGKQRRFQVHRLVLEAFVGPCPEGQQACHNNNVRSDNCLVNLRWDTLSANMRDKAIHGTDPNLRKTHCPQGHEYNVANTYLYRGKWRGRGCRVCARDRARAKKAAASEKAA
jgi:hypothetical protein